MFTSTPSVSTETENKKENRAGKGEECLAESRVGSLGTDCYKESKDQGQGTKKGTRERDDEVPCRTQQLSTSGLREKKEPGTKNVTKNLEVTDRISKKLPNPSSTQLGSDRGGKKGGPT